jgi:dihydropteroate synthase
MSLWLRLGELPGIFETGLNPLLLRSREQANAENAMILSARGFRFEFPRPVLIMGIVNVTPDSFSDGGRFFEPGAAIEHGLKLAAEGADILDVGGESTRPNAAPVSEAEELRRTAPVVEALAARSGKAVSIDTYKPAVARAAVDLGASIINDIAAHRDPNAMWDLAARSGAAYVLMHMKGTPQSMQAEAKYESVVSEVGEFFREKIERLAKSGVKREQLLLDPGIGFAKNAEHNLQLLAGLNGFTIHGRPLLIGASRKSFIGKVLGSQDRLPGSLACAAWAVGRGAQIIRTHDVAATREVVRMIEQIQARQARQS